MANLQQLSADKKLTFEHAQECTTFSFLLGEDDLRMLQDLTKTLLATVSTGPAKRAAQATSSAKSGKKACTSAQSSNSEVLALFS